MLQDELQNMHVWKLLSKGTRSTLRKCSVTILPSAICRLQVMFSPKKRTNNWIHSWGVLNFVWKSEVFQILQKNGWYGAWLIYWSACRMVSPLKPIGRKANTIRKRKRNQRAEGLVVGTIATLRQAFGPQRSFQAISDMQLGTYKKLVRHMSSNKLHLKPLSFYMNTVEIRFSAWSRNWVG